MKVLITGGTGFVGSHTTAELLRAGHDVRLLVRDPARIGPALDPLEVRLDDVVVGDATDPEAVEGAVSGCDAVIHAASVYSYDPRDIAAIAEVNVRSTEVVLRAATAAACDPIVHVSSTSAYLPGTDAAVTEESPVGTEQVPYARSKADSERVARRFQADGHPVVTTYPGAVLGPFDPYLKELNRMLTLALTYPMVPAVPGRTMPMVDVRDVARAHAAVLESGRGPRRYILVGTNIPWPDAVGMLAQETGRRLRRATIPVSMALSGATMADRLQKRVKTRFPLSRETVVAGQGGPPFDATRARDELGVVFRPLEESLRDTVRWLVEAGHVPERKAGSLLALA